MNVKIEKIEDKSLYSIDTPYNKEFVNRIKQLGGKWSGSKWVIPADALELAKECMRAIYGTDGTYTSKNIKVRLSVDGKVFGSYEEFGRTLVKIFGRDSGASPADGVIIVSGEATSGGSIKNPATILNNCVLEFYLPENYLNRDDVKKAIEEGRLTIVEKTKRTREEILDEIRRYEEAIALLKKDLEEE